MKRVSLADQDFAQFGVVVNRTIEHDGVALAHVVHGLMPGRRQIDDGQATMSEHHRPVKELALLSGPRRATLADIRLACCALIAVESKLKAPNKPHIYPHKICYI